MIILLLVGCAHFETQGGKIYYTNLDKPFSLIATKNFLPSTAGRQRHAYIIYEGSKWDCKYDTDDGNYICCQSEPYSSKSLSKYCLLVDKNYNGYALMDLGDYESLKWVDGKQAIFRRSD